MRAPIAVMSFNRPGSLAKVLRSLLDQNDPGLENREIHLFQDNAVNSYSHFRYASDSDIRACVDVFRAMAPTGTVHLSPRNIGVCENFKRAEEYFFRTRGVECAYFFEDDMVLSPAHLPMMDHLQKQTKQRSDRIAYFAAYGDYYASKEEIRNNRKGMKTLDHHWAFGLFREPWLQINDWLFKHYYGLVVGNDYARRNHKAIYDMYAGFGACPRASSQDAAKAFACAQLGLWRCRTVVPFAKYIGVEGAHMKKELFEKLNFGRTEVEPEPEFAIEVPDEEAVRAAVSAEVELFKQIFRTEFDDLTRGLSRKLNPMRRVTEEDVIVAYRHVLHREPEDAAMVQRHVGKTTVFALVQGLLSSSEYARIKQCIED